MQSLGICGLHYHPSCFMAFSAIPIPLLKFSIFNYTSTLSCTGVMLCMNYIPSTVGSRVVLAIASSSAF